MAGTWDVTPAVHLHTELHRRRADAAVVVHNHPPYASALAGIGELPDLVHQNSSILTDELVLVADYDGEVDRPALGAELAILRRHATEPVGDLVRRVVSTLGVDVELVAARGPGATAQLGAFLDAVADFTSVDSDATVHGLLGFLDAPRVRIYNTQGQDIVTDQSGRAGFNLCQGGIAEK